MKPLNPPRDSKHGLRSGCFRTHSTTECWWLAWPYIVGQSCKGEASLSRTVFQLYGPEEGQTVIHEDHARAAEMGSKPCT